MNSLQIAVANRLHIGLESLGRINQGIKKVLLNTYREALRENPNFLRTHLIPMFILTTTNIRGNVDSVSETIIFEYFNRINHSNVSQILQPFINMSTDAMYVACNDITVHSYAATGAPVYMYTFEYRGENSMVELQYGTPIAYFDPGVSHGDELLYLFSLDVDGLRQPSLLDNLVSGRVVSLWTDFAKFGEAPQFVNYEYPRWEPYKPENQAYYRIERDLKPESFYKQRAVDMWTRHLPALAGMTTPTSSPLTQNKHSESLYRTLAWAMVAVSIALLVVVIVLLVTIGIAFQASIAAEVSACSEDGRFGWLHNLRSNSSQRCSMGFRLGSEKASPVFEHPFRQTTSVQVLMCEWSSYPAGREMGLPRNIALELGVQHCPECPHTSQSSSFQSQELMDTGQTTRNTTTPLCFHHQT
ncbi:esterase FE4 [Trichonephila clavipes]|nr:esterase FE4 [Trichonephila clavipes]